MVPLCEIGIPNSQSPNERDNSIKGSIVACDKVLNVVLEGLAIPDKEDREWRITLGGDNIATIAFTCGPDEYGEGPFFPSAEQIQNTGEKALSIFKEAGIGINGVRMESWENTAFILRDPENKEGEKIVLPPDSLRKVGEKIKELKISIALSPEIINKTAIGTPIKEQKPFNEEDVFETAGKGITDLIKETINLPETETAVVNITYPLAAQTDIAVDIDFSMAGKEMLSPEECLSLAEITRNYLDENPNTQTGIATIWIRQGKPETFLVTSEN